MFCVSFSSHTLLPSVTVLSCSAFSSFILLVTAVPACVALRCVVFIYVACMSLCSVDLHMLAARLDAACRAGQPIVSGYCTLPRRPAASRRPITDNQRWLSLTTAGRFAIVVHWNSDRLSPFYSVMWAREHRRISPPRFLAECRKGD